MHVQTCCLLIKPIVFCRCRFRHYRRCLRSLLLMHWVLINNWIDQNLRKIPVATNVIVFENLIVYSQPQKITGSHTLLKRIIDIILLSNTEITVVISVLRQIISVKSTTAMHTGWRYPFKLYVQKNKLIWAKWPVWITEDKIAPMKTALTRVWTNFWMDKNFDGSVFRLHRTHLIEQIFAQFRVNASHIG